MSRLRPIRGKDLIKILCNNFGFVKIRQKGSHVTLELDGTFVTVPLKEIRVGLLNTLLKDCNISREEFLKLL
ncbi:MAG TPA: type II toxin-antitoxin system HicA family toxin [Candidatus Dormibacteraeota bacterium]|nr:type II toxin-antitoxin system HicA family toxin [Candidatus Dormibacteraeota bacterium]